MSDMWLTALNESPSNVLCQTTDGAFRKNDFQQRVVSLQKAILSDGRKSWLLYEEKGFDFLCSFFALLTSGCKVFVIGNNRTETLKELLTDEVGYVGCVNPSVSENYLCSVDLDSANFASIHEICSSEWGSVVFCSSGSTGKPKLIEKSVEQLFDEVAMFADCWELKHGSTFAPLVPHFHIYGLTFGYLLPLLTNSCFLQSGKSGLLGSVEPINLGEDSEVGDLVVIVSPSFARQFSRIEELSHPRGLINKHNVAKVTRVFCAGGLLTIENAKILNSAFDCPVTEIYGSTETGAVGTRNHGLSNSMESNNYWKTLPGIEAKIVDSGAGTKFGEAEEGTIGFWGGHVGGSEESPITPGDEARLLKPNKFELRGRNSQICKIEGKRVSLGQFQELLNGCEWVSSSYTLPLEKNNRELLVSGIVLSKQGVSCYRDHGKQYTDNKIKSYLLKRFDPVLIPRSLRYLDHIPESDMGKVSHENLLELLVDPTPVNFPIILGVTNFEKSCTVSLKIPVNLDYFKGHFSDRPIIPGVVLVHWVYQYTQEYLGMALNPAKIKQLKFSNPAGPGEELTLSLELIAGSVRFRYLGENDQKFSSGEIPILEETQID